MNVGTLKSQTQSKPHYRGNLIIQVTGSRIIGREPHLEGRIVQGREVAAEVFLIKIANAAEAAELATRKFGYLKDEKLQAQIDRMVSFATNERRPDLGNFLTADSNLHVGVGGVIQVYEAEVHPADGLTKMIICGARKMATAQELKSHQKMVITGQLTIEGQDGEKPWRRIRAAMVDQATVVQNAMDLKNLLAHQLRIGNEPFVRLIEGGERQGILVTPHLRDDHGRMVMGADHRPVILDPEEAVQKGLQGNKDVLNRALQREAVTVEVIPTRSFPVSRKTVEFAIKHGKMPLDRYITDGSNQTDGAVVGHFDKIGYRYSFVHAVKVNQGNEPVELALDAAPIGTGRRAYSIIDLATPNYNPFEPQQPRQQANRSQSHDETPPMTDKDRPTTAKGRPMPVEHRTKAERTFDPADDPDHVPGETMEQGLSRIESELAQRASGTSMSMG